MVEQVLAESASRRAFSGTDIAALGLLRVIDTSLPCDGEEFAREAMACCDVTPSLLGRTPRRRMVTTCRSRARARVQQYRHVATRHRFSGELLAVAW